MSRAFEESSLWRTAFGPRTKDRHADQRKFLEIAYRQFREAVLPLLRQTAIDLPALTIHDETHVDQLWDVASEICGTDYPLNPLEAFVLGGAFLLHDSALCIAAYENAGQGLMQTDAWHDAVARLWRRRGIDTPSEQQKQSPPDDLKNAATFDVLRQKHSQQASILIDRTWKHPTTGKPILLLENSQLQEDYGKLIGQIAASHHWQVKLVEDSFPTIIPASTNWPREWEIDPLKLACILRCADAAAIDDRRAPSRLFAFRTPTDTSRRHWAFQNNLYPAVLEQETLVFVSKTPFGLTSMEDWWLCFDAVNVVDEELKASNASLAAHNRAPLAARQVFGAKVTTDFQRKVSVKGWTPVETSLRVSDIPSIIKRFGGTKLYGDDAYALFRELIQNSADAIRARRRRDFAFRRKAKYSGMIRVRMKDLDDKTVEISFEDDGIGMPPSVLTGPLLDFGTSFWNTELASLLYPGLQSDAEFKPAGKYGIGFFSAFMFSDHVEVRSRSFTKGVDDLFALVFKNGLNGRAELRQHDPLLDGEIEENTCTIVKVRVPTEKLFTSLSPPIWHLGTSPPVRDGNALFKLIHVSLSQLCFALDVSVLLELGDGTFVQVNEPFYADWSNETFLTNLDKTFMDGASLSPNLAKCVEPLINDDGHFCGRAFVPITQMSRASVETIDGFARKHVSFVGRGAWEGVLEEVPTVVSRREGTGIATPSAWRRWAKKQLDHLMMDRDCYTNKELYCAAAHLSQFDVEILPLVHCYLIDWLVPLAECVDVFKKKKQLMFLVSNESRYRQSDEPQSLRLDDVDTFCRPIDEEQGGLVEPKDFIQSFGLRSMGEFERVSDDLTDVTSNNILSCFLRLLNENAIRFSVALQSKVPIGKYSGFDTNWIRDGEAVKADVVLVSRLPAQRKPSRKVSK